MLHLIVAMTLSGLGTPIPLDDPFWKPATKEELKLVNPKEQLVKAKQKAYFKCDSRPNWRRARSGIALRRNETTTWVPFLGPTERLSRSA